MDLLASVACVAGFTGLQQTLKARRVDNYFTIESFSQDYNSSMSGKAPSASLAP